MDRLCAVETRFWRGDRLNAMLRWLKRLIKAITFVIVIVLLTPIAGLAYGLATTGVMPRIVREDAAPVPEAVRAEANAIRGYRRPEESTFLTYPEWAIVYAAREYAGFVQNNREYGFPYWAYIGRFWQDYAMVIRATRTYPFNTQNHVMLVVIGTSHTIEHALQWAYENAIGRLTGIAAPQPVAEDRFQANVATEYAAFLDQVPWYRFDYADKRAELWSIPAATGTSAIRSYERKLAFGLSYSIKQGYADLVASGLAATSDPALLDIHVWAKGPVELAIKDEADTQLLADFGDDGAIFVTRRYQAFTEMVPRLINRGLRFVEIGGNGTIFMTVVSDGPVAPPPGAATLFSYALPAVPGKWRTGIVAPVSQLQRIVPTLSNAGAGLEHIYDY